jgi:hypothetical protein
MAFEYPPTSHPNLTEWCRKLAISCIQSLRGKTDNTGTFTLTANSATTTVTETQGRIGTGTVIHWSPTTANASAALANVYLSSRSVSANTFTLTHTNNAQVDRTFSYTLTG